MKRIFLAYKDLLGIMFKEAPFLVIATLVATVLMGFLPPLVVFVNQRIFDGGLAVAAGDLAFSTYARYLVLLVLTFIVPTIYGNFIYNYVENQSLLILRTAYRALALKKLKTLKYEHFENEESMEIIDKATGQYGAENAARHLWPMYLVQTLSSTIASVGLVIIVVNIRWWLLITVLAPFVIELIISHKTNFNIYNELQQYWKKERQYSMLGQYLFNRKSMQELKAFGSSQYMIDTYEKRLNTRNRDYERYFFRNLKYVLLSGNLTRVAAIGNIIIMLVFFMNGHISIGAFIAVSGMLFSSIYNEFGGATFVYKWAPMHILGFNFYDKFFKLSDESPGNDQTLPGNFDIEFKNVWFRYPGTDRDILKGLSFSVKAGEKASIVGENGEGKTTMIKLLLGLFTPDKGEILVGGKSLEAYPLEMRAKIFGPVFQNFQRYSITLQENIGIGNIAEIDNMEKVTDAAKKGSAHNFAESFADKYQTLLGKDFDGGTDLSGGQWQRIAIARAFMGNKPVLLLDEPTSQLDPMAEADLYKEFAEMATGKTAIFITHRLGSTMITDNILVIGQGVLKESGNHDTLMAKNGIYAEMFNAQKQWYIKEEVQG